MGQIHALTEEAIDYIVAHHRHKTISFPDCRECVMKQLLIAIRDEAKKALKQNEGSSL